MHYALWLLPLVFCANECKLFLEIFVCNECAVCAFCFFNKMATTMVINEETPKNEEICAYIRN